MKQRFSKRTRLVSALLTLAMVCTFLPFSAFAANTASTGIAFNSPDFKLNFPDEEFRRFLRDYCDTNNDGKLDVDIKSMTIPASYAIKSLEGIRFFEDLEKLDCHGIGLTTLNVGKNFKLKELDCSKNQLKESYPILSSGLKKLNCSNNKLTYMNLGILHGLNLEEVNCSNNNITNIVMDSVGELVKFDCSNNDLMTLDVSQCFKLQEYLINGAVETECPQLRIIEPELFEQAQELRQARTCERGGTSLGTSSKALLTGLVYCGHCGNRLSLTSSGRTHTYADGHTVKEVRPRYSCFYKIRHPGDCDGQSGYGVSKLDSIVEEVVRQIFAQFREVSRKKLLESVKTNDAARIQKKIKKIQKDLEAKQKELDDLKAETILVIRGVSALDKELLGTLVAEAKDALETLEKQLVQAQEEYEEATKTAKRSNYICNELFTWADVYDTANHDERRAILQQFIKEIRVRKDYEISITLNASFNQVEQLKSVSIYDGAEIFEEISEKGA